MPAKPSTLPSWASSGSIVEPSAGKKLVGHEAGEQPPAEYFNWLFNLLYQWTQFIDSPNTITFGADLLATIANALTARISASAAALAVSPYTLLASLGSVRVYVGAADGTPSILLVSNAVYGTAGTWTKVVNSQTAVGLFVMRDRLRLVTMPLAQNTAWTDAIVTGDGTTSGWGRVLDFGAGSALEAAAAADIARLYQQTTVTAGVERVLIFQFAHATLGDVAIYYTISNNEGDAGALEIAINATYFNSTDLWSHGKTAVCSKLILSGTRFVIKWKASAAAGTTFADSAWTDSIFDIVFRTASGAGAGDETLYNLRNGRIQFAGTAAAQADDANPPSTSATANKLHAKNIPKAWGTVTDGTATPTIADGYNVASVSRDTTADTITVTFATAMQSADYHVEIQGEYSSPLFSLHNIVSKTTGGFTVNACMIGMGSPASAAQIDLVGGVANSDINFTFAVFARQDT
jgi:hypothetical protein